MAYEGFEGSIKLLVSSEEDICKTIIKYTISVNGDTLRREDLNCQFNGYEIFKSDLFGRERLKLKYN